MVGKLIIDGKDAFSEYGVFVEHYGYGGLIQMPPFKNVTITEWEEYDGEEPDLMNPLLGSKTFGIKFCITDAVGAGDLYELISDKSYHIFEFVELKRKYKLRLVSNPAYSSFIKIGTFTLNFSDDFPPVVPTKDTDLDSLDEYNMLLQETPLSAPPNGFKQKGYALDDVDFSLFGVYLIKGTVESLHKAPEVRSNLKIDSKSKSGVEYDDENVNYRAKDTVVKMLIHADGIDDFWKRWNALFTVLLQPEQRSIYMEDTLEDYECYYKNNSVNKFDILTNGKIWCEFTVTMRMTNTRPTGNYLVLATEDGELVITEEDESVIVIRV